MTLALIFVRTAIMKRKLESEFVFHDLFNAVQIVENWNK